MHTSDDGWQREEERGKEKAFRWVREGGAKFMWITDEAGCDQASQDDKEEEIEDEDDLADGEKAVESMRLKGEEQSDTACRHGKRKPGPREVVYAIPYRDMSWIFARF